MTGILSTCAVCGRPVATKACARCRTLYCSQHCQTEHWNTGHKKQCKKIQRAGGAEQYAHRADVPQTIRGDAAAATWIFRGEQRRSCRGREVDIRSRRHTHRYHADKKAKEAADAAVAACTAEGVPQDAECFICKSSIAGKGIVNGCACHGGMGLAHVACLVRQAEAAVKEMEECRTGQGMHKWQKCFDCGQQFHGAVNLALGWAAWKMYLGLPEHHAYRITAMAALGSALRISQCKEALPVLEANLALVRRYWSQSEDAILTAQTNLAACLDELGRDDEALVLKREVYARRVATRGVSHERTRPEWKIPSVCPLVMSLPRL